MHEGAIGLHRAVHAHHAQAEGVIHRQGRQAVQGEGDGDVGLCGKLLQIGAGIAADHAVSA